jgi:drug/metabolite transporter (DMT)-like permease
MAASKPSVVPGPPPRAGYGTPGPHIWKPTAQQKVLLWGAVASLSYGLWGFLDKLASSENIYVTNLLLYGTAFAISLAGLRQRRGPSLVLILSGLSGGAINVLALIAMQRQHLVLVYPFVSFGSVVFLLLAFFVLRVQVRATRPRVFWGGVATTLAGLVICGLGLSGGIRAIDWNAIDQASIALGGLISLATGLWIFLAYYGLTRQNYSPLTATTWVFFGSFLLAVVLAALSPGALASFRSGPELLLPVVAGGAMFLGEYATYSALDTAPEQTSGLQQTLAVFLSNSELIPIILLSYLFLHERTVEGLIGSVVVLAGLLTINAVSSLE